jgi:hypothetical protein
VRFIGRNRHDAVGEWELPCTVDVYDEPKARVPARQTPLLTLLLTLAPDSRAEDNAVASELGLRGGANKNRTCDLILIRDAL